MRYDLAIVATALIATPAVAAAGSDNPFAGTIYQAIAAAIVFIAVLFILRKAAWGPILKGLQDRESRIRNDLQSAERAAQQAQNTLQEYQSKLAAAQEEAKRVIDQGRADAQKIAAGIKDQAQRDIDQMRQRAESEIRSAKEQAVGELYARTGELATAVAERILKHEIRSDDHQQLIEDSLAQLTQSR